MNRKLNVYLYGQKTGVLSEDEQGYLSFKYEQDAKFPLSVRMPVRSEAYGKIYAEPFFDNLVPEGDGLNIIAQKFSISEKNTFSVLDKIGGDCAGAVSLYEDMPVSNFDDPLLEINEDLIAHIIQGLPDNPLLTGIKNAPRLSLAGAQSKFAVCKINGKYFRSDDDHPTTHIIKITNRHFPNLLENEFFCMRLAQQILGTITVELCEIKGIKFLEIERYDRHIVDGRILRIHQEDFCQVLGIMARRKYQQEQGPNLRDCYNAVIEYSAQALVDANRFIEQAIFNFLIGNTDAHGKNFSLLHKKGNVCLSPAYDLLSTEVYPEKLIDHYMAMLINGKGKYDAVGKKDFIMLFEHLDLNATNTMRLVKDKFAGIAEKAETLRDDLNSTVFKNEIYDLIIDIIKRRIKKLFNE
jgi:serine/threonine-protein kinase HipA